MIKIKNYIEIAAQKIYNNSCLASDVEKYNTNNVEIQQKIAYLSKFGVRYKNCQRDLAAVFRKGNISLSVYVLCVHVYAKTEFGLFMLR